MDSVVATNVHAMLAQHEYSGLANVPADVDLDAFLDAELVLEEARTKALMTMAAMPKTTMTTNRETAPQIPVSRLYMVIAALPNTTVQMQATNGTEVEQSNEYDDELDSFTTNNLPLLAAPRLREPVASELNDPAGSLRPITIAWVPTAAIGNPLGVRPVVRRAQ